MGRLVRVAQWVALFAPAAVVLHLVLRYGVNVPFHDQWDLIRDLTRLENGSLVFGDLFTLHNEHRMVFPKLLMLALALPTRWNVVAEMLAGIALATASLVVVIALARPILREMSETGRLWAAFTISAMMFSLAQWENWFWGWQIQWFLSVLAAISCVALASWSLRDARSLVPVAAAALAAVVCQFSIASGTALWVVGALMFAFHPRRRLILPLWSALAVAITALYVVGYRSPPGHPSPWVALAQPLTLLHYVANYLSGPLGRHWAIGLAAGVAFLAFAGLAFSRHRQRPDLVLPWIALGLYAAANALVTGIGRVGFGAGQGFSSRYVTIALLLAVALVPLGYLALRPAPGKGWTLLRKLAVASGAIVLTVFALKADGDSLGSLRASSQERSIARDCVLAIDQATDECLRKLYPAPGLVRESTKQLRALAWSGFPATAGQPPGTVRIASSDGARVWRLRPADREVGWLDHAGFDGDVLRVSGWARHPGGNGAAPRRVLVVTGDTLVGSAAVVVARPDVAAHFSDPDLLNSGWVLRLDAFSRADRPRRFKAYLVFDDDVLVPMGGEAVVGDP